MPKIKEKLFDVVCVSTETGKVLWVEPNKTPRNAEAIEKMAIMRQGVENRFFNTVEPGSCKVGDIYEV